MAYGDQPRRNRFGRWCWRWVLPDDLRTASGCTEVSLSHRTAGRSVAVARSLPLRCGAVALTEPHGAGAPVSDQDFKNTLRLARASARAMEAQERSDEAFLTPIVIASLPCRLWDPCNSSMRLRLPMWSWRCRGTALIGPRCHPNASRRLRRVSSPSATRARAVGRLCRHAARPRGTGDGDGPGLKVGQVAGRARRSGRQRAGSVRQRAPGTLRPRAAQWRLSVPSFPVPGREGEPGRKRQTQRWRRESAFPA